MAAVRRRDAGGAAQPEGSCRGRRSFPDGADYVALACRVAGEVLRDYPGAKWHQYDAVARPARRAGQTSTIYQFDKADVIVALDADFLSCGPGSVRYSKDFARRRRLTEENTSMNRLYVIESSPTLTGAKADHRLAVGAAAVEVVARELAAAVSMAPRHRRRR